jgi:hypothetical protein
VRICLIGALAMSLVGCSRQPLPELALASCAGPSAPACFDSWGETEPSGPAAAAMDIRPSVGKAAGRSSTQLHLRAHRAVKSAPHPEQTIAVAAASPAPKAGGKERSASAEAAVAGFETSSSDNPDFLVAIVMAGPDIKSVGDLKGRTIAIDDRYSASGGTVRTAIVAAGAPQVQLSEGQGTAMNRLSNGEVPAAVVALVTPDVADKFPAFAGYRMFQVPLSPYSLKARP